MKLISAIFICLFLASCYRTYELYLPIGEKIDRNNMKIISINTVDQSKQVILVRYRDRNP